MHDENGYNLIGSRISTEISLASLVPSENSHHQMNMGGTHTHQKTKNCKKSALNLFTAALKTMHHRRILTNKYLTKKIIGKPF
jgi:hypothetical protein